MTLTPTFQFSQNSLQDYVDCQRRFQLRFLLRQPWPAVETEPVGAFERLLESARRFHGLVERHNLGISESDLGKSIDSDDVRRWWRNYLESPPPKLPIGARYPELNLSVPLAGYRLVAKYDLVAVDPGRRAVVVDWKTGQRRPDSAVLAARLQTRVYRYVLVEAGTALNGGVPLSPEQVTMVYWFAEHPAQPEILPYDATQHAADAGDFVDLVTRIAKQAGGDEEEWSLTDDTRLCRYCTYRSLCDRGVLPGPLAGFDTDTAFDLSVDFSFEEIEEIEY